MMSGWTDGCVHNIPIVFFKKKSDGDNKALLALC